MAEALEGRGASAGGGAWPRRRSALYSGRRRRRAGEKMEDYQAAEEVTDGSATGSVEGGSSGLGWASAAKACGRVRTWAAAFPTGQRFAVTPPGPLRAASPCPRGGARTGLPAQRSAPSGSCGLAGSAPAAPLSPPADSVRDLLRAGPAPAQAAGAPGVTSLAPFIQGCGPPPWRRRRASRGGGRPRPPVRVSLS